MEQNYNYSKKVKNRLDLIGNKNNLKYKEILDFFDFDQMELDIEEASKRLLVRGRKDKYGEEKSAYANISGKLNAGAKRELVVDHLVQYLQDNVKVFDNCVYFKFNKGWQLKERLNGMRTNSTFGAFLSDCLGRDIFPMDDIDKVMKHFYSRITIDAQYEHNGIIQFNDYYIKDSEFYEGYYEDMIPQHIIERDIKNAVEADIEPEMHPVLKDFLLHLSNGDEEVMHHLLNRISLVFLLSHKHMQLRRFIRLYGPTAENGKSTFLNLLIRTIGDNNATAMSTSDLETYELNKTARSLLAVDADSPSTYLNKTVSKNIKNIVFGDMISIREIYKKPINIIPHTLLIAASNSMPKSSDKSEGLNRRLEWYKIKGKLNRDSNWFNILESDTITQNLLEILIYKAKHVDEYNFYQLPKALEEINAEFKYNNNNVLKFIDEVSSSEIINHSLKHVKTLYLDWCELNEETAFKDTKLNDTLISTLDLRKKRLRIKQIADNDLHPHTVAKDADYFKDIKIQCWVKNE